MAPIWLVRFKSILYISLNKCDFSIQKFVLFHELGTPSYPFLWILIWDDLKSNTLVIPFMINIMFLFLSRKCFYNVNSHMQFLFHGNQECIQPPDILSINCTSLSTMSEVFSKVYWCFLICVWFQIETNKVLIPWSYRFLEKVILGRNLVVLHHLCSNFTTYILISHHLEWRWRKCHLPIFLPLKHMALEFSFCTVYLLVL